MRVTDQILFNSVVSHLQKNTQSLLQFQEKISSSLRINRPSDDPIGISQVLNFETSIAEMEQYLRNIQPVDSLLTASESSLGAVQDQLIRLNELAIQMANATYNAADRTAAGKEVRQIYDQLIALGNTSLGGRYIFAGEEVNTAPFVSQGRSTGTTIALPITITTGVNDGLTISVDGTSATVTLPAGTYSTGSSLASMLQTTINGNTTLSAVGLSVVVQYDTDHLVITSDAVGGTSAVVPSAGNSLATLGFSSPSNQAAGTYLGDSAETQVFIGTGTQLILNIPGDRAFQGTGVSGGVNILSVVGAFQTALETNDLAGINTALSNLPLALEQINGERALLGARLNRMGETENILQDLKLTLERFKSQRADADIPKVISEFSLAQFSLEATQLTAARLFENSLLRFLG